MVLEDGSFHLASSFPVSVGTSTAAKRKAIYVYSFDHELEDEEFLGSFMYSSSMGPGKAAERKLHQTCFPSRKQCPSAKDGLSLRIGRTAI